MQTHLFPLLEPYKDRVTVCFLEKEDAVKNDTGAAQLLGATHVASLQQMHGDRTLIVREPMHRGGMADGMATDKLDLALLLRIADCQGFVIYAPEQNVVGVLHAGWKGLLAGAIAEHFAVLKHEWGIDPAETIVCAAPSLCQACSRFTNPEHELPGIDPQFFDERFVDLRGIADSQFDACGVPRAQRERHADCTRCNADRYWTYRGEPHHVKNGFHNVLTATLLVE